MALDVFLYSTKLAISPPIASRQQQPYFHTHFVLGVKNTAKTPELLTTFPHPSISKRPTALLLSSASRMRPQWESHKEKIRELYLDQGLPLAGVMAAMKHKGLTASQRTYERQLKKWKFEKNWKYDVMRIVKARYASVIQRNVIFDVRFAGNCLDELERKKFEAYRVPLSDKYKVLRPSLPEKWTITPRIPAFYLSSVTTRQLPFECFQIHFDQFVKASGFINMPLETRALVIPALRRQASALDGERHSNLIKDIFHHLCAIMPVEEEADIYSLLGQIVGKDSSSATTQFLKLAIYYLSNKLFDKYKYEYCNLNDELLRWFKIGNHHRLLRGILSFRTPTIDAVAEGLFASALRAEDLVFSRIFLESGLNPDITLAGVFDGRYFNGRPLKLAIRKSNIVLIKLLFEFEANADRASGFTDALVWGAEAGNVEITRFFVSEGAFINAVSKSGPTPLQAALKGGNVEIVRLLLDAGADVNLFGNDRPHRSQFVGCPLSCAMLSGVKALVEMLLERGAKLDPMDARYIGTPLQRAIQSKDRMETRRLLQLEADVNVPASEYDGRTALQGAAENGDLELCQTLIQAGADVNAGHAPPSPYSTFGTIGVTALVAAVYSRNHQVVKLMVKSGADVNAIIRPCRQNHDQPCTALEVATHLDDVDMVQYLIRSGANVGQDGSIHYAVSEKRAELVKILIGAGADINYHPIRNTNCLLSKAVRKEDLDLIQLLLDYGARPDPRCLVKAAQNGNLHIIELLITTGVDINTYESKSKMRKNALQAAASKGNMDIVKYLLDRGADVNWPAANKYGSTALQAAVASGCMELVYFLITRGANVNDPAAVKGGVTALQQAVRMNSKPLVNLLLEAGANANDNPATWYGRSSLQYAAKIGENDLIETLLRHKANINVPVAHKAGQTALQAAVGNGHFTTVRLLLEKGSDVNAVPPSDASFETALQIAARMGYVRIAKALIDAGADLNAPGVGRHGGTALELAAMNGRIDMLKLLLNAGADITTGAGRLQLENALTHATREGHDAVAKLLECHQISKEDMGIADNPVEAGVFQIMEE